MSTAASSLQAEALRGPRIEGLLDLPHHQGPEWGTRWDVARQIGRVLKRPDGNYQISGSHQGERFRIGAVRFAGTDSWVSIRTESDAEQVLYAIRARFASGMTLAAALVPFKRRPGESTRVEAVAARWLRHQERLCEAKDISPYTLREVRRFCRSGGEFARWDGRDVHSVSYGALEDWRLELGTRVSSKTAHNIMGEFRRMLKWLARRGELALVPEFPKIEVDRKPPQILSPEEQRAVLEAIPWRRRGLFLAMAHTLRPGEARAIDLLRWREPYLIVQRACKLDTADAPIRGLKERDWRVVGAQEGLVEWVRWRLDRAPAADRLKRENVPLFPNWAARNPRKLWSASAIHSEWRAACKRAAIPYVSPYPSTKHSTATELIRQGVPQKHLQTLLGHASAESTEKYVVLAGSDVQDLLREKARDLL